MNDFTTFICYSLKSTMKKVEKHITQELEQYGVNMAQSFILFCLLERDGSTLTEIGNRANIENSSLTTMVDKLEKRGLVERRLNAEDRRVVRLYITEEGKKLGEDVLNSGAKLNIELQEKLEGLEKDLLKGLLVISDTLDERNM